MSGEIAFYQTQAYTHQSALPWLAQLQAEGLKDLQRFGLPTRYTEDWKYTLMNAFYQKTFHAVKPNANLKAAGDWPASGLPYAQEIRIINGYVHIPQLLIDRLPAGVIVQPLSKLLQEAPERLVPYLDRIMTREHGFHALNTAMLGEGLVIVLPAGVQLLEPLLISHYQDQADQAVYLRHIIIAEAGAQAAVIEHYQSTQACFSNVMTEIYLDARACLTHYKLQQESPQAFHVSQVSAALAEKAIFNSHMISLGSQIARCDTQVYLQGQNAQCLLNGFYMPASGQHCDHHTAIFHQIPNCHSVQDYKGVVSSKARAVFNGKVVVARNAQQTQAQQQNKNLLLSADAEVDTKPQLEIFADDVTCSHGATVGQIDEEALFYLTSRGLTPDEAKSWLIQAFAVDNLRLIPDTAFRNWLSQWMMQSLKG